jgi:hypothetical protein
VSPRPPSDTGLKCRGPRANLQPTAFGEAGLSVTVVSLPARGRPPQAAARRAGIEFVEKLLTTNLTSADTTERDAGMLRLASRRVASVELATDPGSSWSWSSSPLPTGGSAPARRR